MRLPLLLTPSILLVLATLSAPPLHAQSKPDDAMAGAILYRDKGCAHCHGASEEGTQKAPALASIRTDKNWTPEKITDQILNGGKKMPPFADSLTDPEIAQIVTYLRAKHPPPPPPAASAN
jgi:mono/diheme cytochrome c family protein